MSSSSSSSSLDSRKNKKEHSFRLELPLKRRQAIQVHSSSDEDEDLPQVIPPINTFKQADRAKLQPPVKHLQKLQDTLKKKEIKKENSLEESDVVSTRSVKPVAGKFTLSHLVQERRDKKMRGVHLERIQSVLAGKEENTPTLDTNANLEVKELKLLQESNLSTKILNESSADTEKDRLVVRLIRSPHTMTPSHFEFVTAMDPQDEQQDGSIVFLLQKIVVDRGVDALQIKQCLRVMKQRFEPVVSLGVCEWLYRLVCTHHDEDVASLAHDILLQSIQAPDCYFVLGNDALRQCLTSLYGADFDSQGNPRVSFVNAEIRTEQHSLQDELARYRFPRILKLISASFDSKRNLFEGRDVLKMVEVISRVMMDQRLQYAFAEREEILLRLGSHLEVSDSLGFQCMDIAAEVTKDFERAEHWIEFIKQLPLLTPQWKFMRRQMAWSFFHTLLQIPYKSVGVKLTEIEDLLMTHPDFTIHPETDYNKLCQLIMLLELIMNDRAVNIQDTDSLHQIIMRLKAINGRIADPRGAYLERSRTKDVLLRHALMLSIYASNSTSTHSNQTNLILGF